MNRKVLATALTVVGTVLMLVSTVNLFLILIDRSSHEYFLAASGSMEPALSEGEWVKVKLGMTINEVYTAPKDASPPGDIVAFHHGPDVILHRAVEKITDPSYYLITQGDANPGPDGWRVGEIIGIVVEINPPFWTYNYIFLGVIFSIGIAIMLGEVVLRRPKRIEVHRAYNTMKPEAVTKPAIVEPKPERKFFCRYCGAENKLDAAFCEAFGKKLL